MFSRRTYVVLTRSFCNVSTIFIVLSLFEKKKNTQQYALLYFKSNNILNFGHVRASRKETAVIPLTIKLFTNITST